MTTWKINEREEEGKINSLYYDREKDELFILDPFGNETDRWKMNDDEKEKEIING